MNNLPYALILILLTSACSVTGPAEDDWDLEEKQDRIDLLGKGKESGNRGFTLFDSFEKTPEKNSGTNLTISNDISLPAIDQQSFEEFETFKAWRRSSQPDSVDYQEFQDWKAYQQYRRFKTQQEQTNETSPQ